jgi:hypothetical protein
MIRDSELQEIREQAAKAAGVDLNKVVTNALDPAGEIRAAMAEPLGGGSLAQEAPPPSPTVEGSAIGALPAATAETPTILDPAKAPVEPKATADLPGPDKEVPPDIHRIPPAP